MPLKKPYRELGIPKPIPFRTHHSWSKLIYDYDVLRYIQKFLGVFWFNNNWLPSGMIASVTGGTASITWENHRVTLTSGLTGSDYSAIYKDAIGLGRNYTWDAWRRFAVMCYIMTSTTRYAHIVSGGVSGWTAIANTLRHIGFKLSGNSLYGTVADGTTESTILLETLSANDYRLLECEIVGVNDVWFYVNGTYINHLTTNIPSGTTDAINMMKVSTSRGGSSVQLIIYESRTLQEW